ncbi:MAG: nucleoside triphosphate pyrophosphatase [Acidimicrobiia bacterium]
MTRRPLVLASASPSRLRILRDAGFDPIVRVSAVDEDRYAATNPQDIVRELACRKARAVAEASDLPPAAIVVGCDSLFQIDGVMYGKPGDPATARQRWHMMRGKTGTLLTGHCIIDCATHAEVSATAQTQVTFGMPTEGEIDSYVASGEPIHVAGAFTLEGRASLFIERIEGDPSNVIGLSVPTFRALLTEVGIAAIDLWRDPSV